VEATGLAHRALAGLRKAHGEENQQTRLAQSLVESLEEE
jgi:hypothetical protein